MVSTMKNKALRDMANRMAGEFQSETDFEAFTKELQLNLVFKAFEK